MLTVLVAVRLWGHRYSGSKVKIFCDNDATVQVINSSKARDLFMASCLRELWLEVCTYKFELRVVHLPGEENRLADWLSRWDLDNSYRVKFHKFLGDNLYYYKESVVSPQKFMFSGNL
jgi:hypothetical protein